jgi:hypothetical protein
MKRSSEQLPAELLWEDDGHLSDVVITALGDAQDAIVPAAGHAHLASCDKCMGRVGEAAMLSMDTGEELRNAVGRTEVAPMSLADDSRRRMAMRPPRFAIAAALGIAAIGCIPFALHASSSLGGVWFAITHGLPTLLHTAAHLFASAPAQRAAIVLPVVSAMVLVMAGVLVARALPRPLAVGHVSEKGVSA